MPSMQVVGNDLVLGYLMLKRDEELSALCDRQAEVPDGCLVYGAAEGCQRSFPGVPFFRTKTVQSMSISPPRVPERRSGYTTSEDSPNFYPLPVYSFKFAVISFFRHSVFNALTS